MSAKRKPIDQVSTEEAIKDLYRELKQVREALQEVLWERELDTYLKLEYT